MTSHLDHLCPIAVGAGGLIDPSWCFSFFAERLTALSPITSESDTLAPELLLAEDGPLSIRYCPFDYINPRAKLVIVGITPGRHQMFLACQQAQRSLAEGKSAKDVLREASDTGSFAGGMRANLVTMLDALGLPSALGIVTAAELFAARSELLHSTSALLHPVFVNGSNYSGAPKPQRVPLLRAFVDQVLAAELAMVPDALIIPLGTTVATILRDLADRGTVWGDRCLFQFPHPSGANGHRVRLFEAHQAMMADQIARWAARKQD